MKSAKSNQRRKFLLTAGLGSAAAAGAIVAGRKAGGGAASPTPESQASGYRLTEHVQKYYETAKV